MKTFIDIETIPGQRPELRNEIAAQIAEVPPYEDPKCPRNIKKPETICEWQENTFPALRQAAQQKYQDDLKKREIVIEETWRKTALHGDQGEVICVAWAIEDNWPTVCCRQLHESEAALLNKIFALISEQLNKRNPHWVGHNVQFDLRFLFHRAVILGIKPPFDFHLESRPWGDVVQDTMIMWAGMREKIGLDHLCKTLGIQTKDKDLPDGEKIDGSKVWDFIKRGEIEKVAEYCKADVFRCRHIYKRIHFIDRIAPTVSLQERESQAC